MGRRKSNWIREHRSDTYYKKCKEEGHRARSYYKLKQINEKFHIIPFNRRKSLRILDLGAAPGAWIEYIIDFTSQNREYCQFSSIKVIGVDLISIKPFSDSNFIETIRIDIFSDSFLKELSGISKFDVILSDLAPKTSGNLYDIALQSSMVRKISEFLKFLNKEGNIVIKVFQSNETRELFNLFREKFRVFKQTKPNASRSRSKEIFFVGKSFLN